MSINPNYDALIIGGGINGAAIANIAASCGLKVLLVEKGDFAGGTSSKSTKLIHGGLRYLENFEFDLVREALKERAIQLKNVPHLVKPIEFIIPVYRSGPRPFWMIKLGVFLYDVLSGKYLISKHRILNSTEILQRIPQIQKDGLIGGISYHDAQMDDVRLCLENILNARAKGAKVANYVEVQALLKEKDKVVGVEVLDRISGRKSEIHAKNVICAVGPWANRFWQMDTSSALPKIRTTKGIHLVYNEKICENALLLQTKTGRRIFFVIPWKGQSLIGTTDTDYTGDPDQAGSEEQDVDYLLTEIKRFFPTMMFDKNKIVTTFAGLRPLVYAKGEPGKISRQHVIEKTDSGMIYVLGGKYTTYRRIAEECVEIILGEKLDGAFLDYPLYGSGEIRDDVSSTARAYRVEEKIVELLRATYGTRYRDVLELTGQDPQLRQPICSCSDVIGAQVVYAVQVEMACTVDDIVWRRVGIGYLPCSTKKCREVIRTYLGKR